MIKGCEKIGRIPTKQMEKATKEIFNISVSLKDENETAMKIVNFGSKTEFTIKRYDFISGCYTHMTRYQLIHYGTIILTVTIDYYLCDLTYQMGTGFSKTDRENIRGFLLLLSEYYNDLNCCAGYLNVKMVENGLKFYLYNIELNNKIYDREIFRCVKGMKNLIDGKYEIND